MTGVRWVMLVIWPLVSVLSFVSVVWIWRSKARSEYMERSFQPVYSMWRLRARSLGAASLVMLSTLFLVPREVVNLLRGGALAAGGISELDDTFANAALLGCSFFGLLMLTANMWGRPRWIIPPYLRPERKRDRVTSRTDPGNSSE